MKLCPPRHFKNALMRKMFPRFSEHDTGNRVLAYTKFRGKDLLPYALLVRLSDFIHISLFEFGKRSLLSRAFISAKNPERMFVIFSTRNPLKVCEIVVSSLAVFVVHLRPLWKRTNECEQYKSMRESLFSTHFYFHVPVPIHSWFYNMRNWKTVGLFPTANVSEIAGFVIWKTRHWTPLLNCGRNCIRHFEPFFSRFTVQAGEMTGIIRQPISFLPQIVGGVD